METRESKKIDDAVRAAMREQMEEVIKRVQVTVNEQTQEAIKGVADTLKRLQSMMDQQGAAITELRSNQPHLDSGQSSKPLGKFSAQPKSNVDIATSHATDYPIQLRSPKIDFPIFEGTDLKDWLCKVKQYFEIDFTPGEWKVRIAAMYLEGRALKWYHSFVQSLEVNHTVTWEELVGELQSRFGDKAYEDPMAELKELTQEGSLQEYLEEF